MLNPIFWLFFLKCISLNQANYFSNILAQILSTYCDHVNLGDCILMENPENKILSKKYSWARFIIYLKIIGYHQKVYKS